MPAIAENMTEVVRNLLVYRARDAHDQVVAEVLAEDLVSGKHVVICGTAGSGKTELLFQVLDILRGMGVARTALRHLLLKKSLMLLTSRAWAKTAPQRSRMQLLKVRQW